MKDNYDVQIDKTGYDYLHGNSDPYNEMYETCKNQIYNWETDKYEIKP